MNNFFRKISLALLIATVISGCGKKKDNFEIDISKLNIPKQQIQPKVNDSENNYEKEKIINKLKVLKNGNEVMDSIKYGRVDPFSNVESNSKKIIPNFQLNGIISILEENFALVSFQEKTGVININSVGGSNTKLIPEKSFVKEINAQKEEITISLMNELYNIKIGED